MKGMLQRCWDHDYCAPCFYMITVVTEPRRACLSTLECGSKGLLLQPGPVPFRQQPLAAEPYAGPCSEPTLALSPIGEVVREVWQRTSVKYPAVEACEFVVMPDHFHGILWVKERLRRHMGHIVKAFKRLSAQECRSKGLLMQPNPVRFRQQPPVPFRQQPLAAEPSAEASLWQEGFQDSILLRRGQLQRMVNYIADNPRRLAAKRANPELFTVVSKISVAPARPPCAVIGNRHLLDHPLKYQIQTSRSISRIELDALKEKILHAAEHGAVPVSPCISPGEKEIARAVMDAGHPLIVVLDNGLRPHYKPPGRYFDACVSGNLLMVAPLPYERRKHRITRRQCLMLNEWAAAIAESHGNEAKTP